MIWQFHFLDQAERRKTNSPIRALQTAGSSTDVGVTSFLEQPSLRQTVSFLFSLFARHFVGSSSRLVQAQSLELPCRCFFLLLEGGFPLREAVPFFGGAAGWSVWVGLGRFGLGRFGLGGVGLVGLGGLVGLVGWLIGLGWLGAKIDTKTCHSTSGIQKEATRHQSSPKPLTARRRSL